MKRWLVIVALVLVVGGMAYGLLRHTPQWTTDNREALLQFEAGLGAQQKLYYVDARRHYERALQLDPGFAIAKAFLVQTLDSDSQEDAKATKRLIEELEKTDLEALTLRERFLISRYVASRKGDREAAETILAEYLKTNPDDEFALEIRANRAFRNSDAEQAERDYRRLIEVAPNRVSAYNQIGYLAMGQGRFVEAEQMLRKYRFIAPDQANPHDSLGELFILLGRYDEARQEFDEALRLKPDFCATRVHLVTLGIVASRFDDAKTALAGFEPGGGCWPGDLAGATVNLEVAKAAARRDWEGILKAVDSGSAETSFGMARLIGHRALLELGRTSEAEAVTKKLSGAVEIKNAASDTMVAPNLAHLQGVELYAHGRPAEAARRFAEVDAGLLYRGVDEGLFKLYNLANLARALRASGDSAAADEVAERILAVNGHVATAVFQGLDLNVAASSR